jgi:hypothetical protein
MRETILPLSRVSSWHVTLVKYVKDNFSFLHLTLRLFSQVETFGGNQAS